MIKVSNIPSARPFWVKKWQKLRYLKNVAVFAIGIFFCQIASRCLNSWRKRIAQTFLHFNLAAGGTDSPQLPKAATELGHQPRTHLRYQKKNQAWAMWCVLQSWLSVMRFPLSAKGGQIPSWHPLMWNRLAAWLSSSADNSSRTCQLSKNELQQTNSRRVQNQGNHNDLAEKHACAHYRQPRGGQMGSQVAEWHFTFFQLAAWRLREKKTSSIFF